MVNKNNNFDSYSKYYDLFYKDKCYFDEVNDVVETLKKFKDSGNKILEYGCGTGVHAREFVNKGYTVHGIDLSEEMISKIKPFDGFTFEHGNICELKLNSKFDFIISLFHVFSYQVENESLESLFFRANEHLNVGGLFAFDFWYSPAVYNQKASVRIKRLTVGDVEIIRIAEPEIFSSKNSVDVHYTIIERNLTDNSFLKFSEKHSMRHFSLPEIEFISNAHGFELVAAHELITKNVPSEDTWAIFVVLRKK
jgi:cyclopropane fatty-acyl-phospholipid synthase-like methyltransferase